MKNCINKLYKAILWDFDGVIVDSMKIRTSGFESLFGNNYPKEKVLQLVEYHLKNGGLSRYHKIRYFFENILETTISQDEVLKLASEFSLIMRSKLINPALLIKDTVEFIRSNYQNFEMHIVSGSDGEELRYLCKELQLTEYFLTIQGSPTPKIDLVKNVLERFRYNTEETLLIGDSINDYEAATANGISFMGYNNNELSSLGVKYLDDYCSLLVP